jgi:DNA end-binding protein Ku
LGLKAAGVSEKEIDMATRLVEDMSEDWDPERYRDTYREDLLARVEQKVRAKQTHVIPEPGKETEPARGAQIIDLVSMLRQSLERQGAQRAPARKAARSHASAGTADQVPAKRAARKASAAGRQTEGEPRRRRAR